ncbi:MAG: hypothetical protein LJE91_17270, partial [Gammaproteobacteria bacterium]|nr:hypothetical protein [Gammaproteobacteria bacterium]
ADDESLGAGLAEAERRLAEASAALTTERRALEAYDGESIRTLATNSRKVAGDAERKFNDARQVFAGVRSLVEVGREKGLFERAQEARDRASVCVDNLARVEARADGVKRLREVLLQCQQQAYEKHRAPFRERVEKLSRLAFGKDVQVELAENLTVSRRTMDGVTLEFRQLSGGAQEQLGLASRLATAMLLGDDGGPLMLDDTLGHSDPECLRGLGAMLGGGAGAGRDIHLSAGSLRTCRRRHDGSILTAWRITSGADPAAGSFHLKSPGTYARSAGSVLHSRCARRFPNP